MVVWSLEHFMLSPAADILPYLNTSVKGTAVNSILFLILRNYAFYCLSDKKMFRSVVT